MVAGNDLDSVLRFESPGYNRSTLPSKITLRHRASSYLEVEHPILRCNFVRPRKTETSRNEYRSHPKEVPSLLSLNLKKPLEVKEEALKFLQQTQRWGCWKCGENSHCFKDCPHSSSSDTELFCYKCGEIGVKVKDCPHCKDKCELYGSKIYQIKKY